MLKTWEFPGSNFDLKNGNSKNLKKKNENSQFFMPQAVKKIGNSHFLY